MSSPATRHGASLDVLVVRHAWALCLGVVSLRTCKHCALRGGEARRQLTVEEVPHQAGRQAEAQRGVGEEARAPLAQLLEAGHASEREPKLRRQIGGSRVPATRIEGRDAERRELGLRQREIVRAVEVHDGVEVGAEHEEVVERHQRLRLLVAGRRQRDQHDLAAAEGGRLLERRAQRIGAPGAQDVGDRAAEDADHGARGVGCLEHGLAVAREAELDRERVEVCARDAGRREPRVHDVAEVGMQDAALADRGRPPAPVEGIAALSPRTWARAASSSASPIQRPSLTKSAAHE